VHVRARFLGGCCRWRPQRHRVRVRAALGGRLSLWPPPVHDRSWTSVRREAGCLTCLAAALCTSGRLSLAFHEASDCARTGLFGNMVLRAPRSISKTERRRGLRELCRVCRCTLSVGDDHPLCAPSFPFPCAARTRPISEAPSRAAGADAPPPRAVNPPCLGPLPSRPPSPQCQDPRPFAWRPPPTWPPSPFRQGPGLHDRRPGPCRPPSPPCQGSRSSEWRLLLQRPPSALHQGFRSPDWRPGTCRPPSSPRQGLRPPDWRPGPCRPPSRPRQGLRPPAQRPGPCRPPSPPLKVLHSFDWQPPPQRPPSPLRQGLGPPHWRPAPAWL